MNKKTLRNKAFLMSNTFSRTKLFHSKKGWILSSALFLALLGFGAVSTSTISANSTLSAVNNNTPTEISSASNVKNIQQRAKNLHKSIINTNINTNKSTSSNNVKNNLANVPSNPSNDSNTSALNTSHKPNKTLTNSINLQINKGTNNQEGSYEGLTYTYDSNSNALEFVNGKANGSLIHFISNANGNNSCIKAAKSIKFDNNIDVSQVSDMSFMFASDSNLQSLDLGNNFNTINTTNTALMFHNDINLQSLNLGPEFDTHNVTNMYEMFGNATNKPSKLQFLDLGSKFNTQKVTSMGGMFQGNTSLQSLNLGSKFNTCNVSDMSAMFEGDSKLQSLNLPKMFITNNVKNMKYMFNQTPIQSITINSSNTQLDNTTGLSNLYKKNEGSYDVTPNNFNQSNIGTFVSANIAEGVTPSNNPNQYMANNNPALVDNQWNQNYHFNNPQGNNNDVEAILPHYNNGKIDYWDIYYLWNPDPGNVGPNAYDEWGITRTKDFSNFYSIDKNNPVSLNNVAIPNPSYEINGKNRVEVASTTPSNIAIPWYQVAGGSVISNKKSNGGQWLIHDTFGNTISSDARLAYFANYKPGNTGSYLAYANPNTNGGYQQFRPYSENNIFTGNMVGVGITGDFRDPYVMINPLNPNQLVAYLAGGSSKKVYVLTSNDAINWKSSSVVNLNYFGNGYVSIEAPYVTKLNGMPIMFFNVQTPNYEGEYYITGSVSSDGIFETNSNSKVSALDVGPDDYAGNFTRIDNNHLIFMAWLNNWKYFNGTQGIHSGGFTLPRVISWNGSNIDVVPIEPNKLNKSDKNNNGTYNVNGKVNMTFAKPMSSFVLTFTRFNNQNNYVTFNFNNGDLNVIRKGSANGAYDFNGSVKLNTSVLSNIQFYLDNNSIEAYMPEIHQVYSILDYDNERNIPYIITCNVPTKINSYQFQMGQAPILDNINGINSKYSTDKSDFNKDLNIINNKSDASNTISLLNSYFNDIQNQLQNANTNINQAILYNNDARQHSYITLANDAMNSANVKLYQAGIQLNYLDKIAANAPKPASASSQSNSESSAASQNSNSSSSVAPSSAQQPSDNTNSTPFIPSFNIPSVPSTTVVTPTQNNTTSMNDNNNSSVVPSVEPQTTNTTVNKHYNTRIARNHHTKRGSIYLFNTDFKGLSKRNRSVITTKGIRAYKYVRTYKRTRRGHYTHTGHYVAVKYIRPNTKLAVKRVVKFGKITKLQLTNGWLVTSNKHYVAVNKIAKRTNKCNAKRAIKGIDATRYSRALRKSNYVLRHGRRHATRYTYRMAKKFNRANNFEKKAYRKFARKHTNRNRKACNKAIINLKNLVNALLK